MTTEIQIPLRIHLYGAKPAYLTVPFDAVRQNKYKYIIKGLNQQLFATKEEAVEYRENFQIGNSVEEYKDNRYYMCPFMNEWIRDEDGLLKDLKEGALYDTTIIPFHLVDFDLFEDKERELVKSDDLTGTVSKKKKTDDDSDDFLKKLKIKRQPIENYRMAQKLYSVGALLGFIRKDEKIAETIVPYYIDPLEEALEYYLPEGATVNSIYTSWNSVINSFAWTTRFIGGSNGTRFYVNYTLDGMKKTVLFDIDVRLNSGSNGLSLESTEYDGVDNFCKEVP